jgi:hypothetical protein
MILEMAIVNVTKTNGLPLRTRAVLNLVDLAVGWLL